jgi:putative iron-dependent peroxidase
VIAPQSLLLQPPPPHARILTFGLVSGDARESLARVRALPLDPLSILGLGAPLVAAAERRIEGLRAFPALAGPGCAFPSTQGALWALVEGADEGETLHRARKLRAALGDAFRVDEEVSAFKYAEGRDLSGYEDGTENPKGERAAEVAIVAGAGEGLDGGSFVSTQRWVHDLARLERMSPEARDHAVGRRIEDNEEIADAPPYAHVKRSAQESFDPPAFMLRRSMPFGGVGEHGLYFIAFCASLDPFERVLRRMAGLEDGITDGLLRFSRAVSGGHYWCPPVREGKLDLRAIGL